MYTCVSEKRNPLVLLEASSMGCLLGGKSVMESFKVPQFLQILNIYIFFFFTLI